MRRTVGFFKRNTSTISLTVTLVCLLLALGAKIYAREALVNNIVRANVTLTQRMETLETAMTKLTFQMELLNDHLARAESDIKDQRSTNHAH